MMFPHSQWIAAVFVFLGVAALCGMWYQVGNFRGYKRGFRAGEVQGRNDEIQFWLATEAEIEKARTELWKKAGKTK